MSRRRRAATFTLLAVAAAAVAATIADGYGTSVARSYGPLRQVVVASSHLPAGEPIAPQALASRLEVRRVPARFVPPGTLTRVEDVVGLEPTARLSAGSYVTAAILRPPQSGQGGPRLAAGHRPVQIMVSGAGALIGTGGGRVDVVVTSEPSGPGPGRTYVAAAAVPLLALRPTGSGPGATAAATLGLTRSQALTLISAQNFARQVTVLPSNG